MEQEQERPLSDVAFGWLLFGVFLALLLGTVAVAFIYLAAD